MKKNLGVATAIVVVAVVIALVVGIAGGYLIAPKSTSTTSSKIPSVVNIGAAIPLTGSLGTYGQNAAVALKLAESQINAQLAAANAGWSINLTILDTGTNADTALADTQSLYTDGCQAIIGYYSSSELQESMSYAQKNDIVLISPSSTAISLAIPKPYIFRFVPADSAQGPAMAAGIKSENITYIVPIYMTNVYGEGLVQATENAFVGLGGQYDQTNISYDPTTTTDFSSLASILNTEVTKAISTYGASHVGVYAVTYEEVSQLMDACAQYPALESVNWFGCDGSALASTITADPVAAAFAIKTNFTATYFAPTNSTLQTEVMNYVAAQTGNVPDPYCYGSYDALWVLADCIGLSQQYSGTSINAILPTVANMTFGASGLCTLNSVNDRIGGDYQFWNVYSVNSTAYSWYLGGYYSASTGTVTWYPAP